MSALMPLIVLFFAALWAGCQNALAGGGSFITLPALMFTGMDARAANITSTVALFPGYVATAAHGWPNAVGAAGLSRTGLVVISLAGGAVGGTLLLLTPSGIFARMVPFLVLFATVMFAWGSFGPKRKEGPRLNAYGAGAAQFAISVYGGYFGGGIGFLMLAAFAAAGLLIRNAGATKNVLTAVMNFSAMLIFLFSPQVHWPQAAVVAVGAMIGGLAGAHMLNRIADRPLQIAIVLIGVALTIGLFIRAP